MKRRFLVGFAVLLCAHRVLAQNDTTTILFQAKTAYDSGNYAQAINLYESVLMVGWRDPVVYFNLGNAYYQSEDLGHALLNYLRAQQFIPRDGDLNANLALVRAQRIDLQGDETTLLHGMAVLTTGILTLPELGWLVLTLWTMWFGLLLAALLRDGWREPLRVPLVVMALVALVGIVLLASRLYTMSSRPAAVVLAARAGVMTGPGEQYLEIFSLHSGAELHLLETRGDWVRFLLPDGRQGWLPVSTIEKV